jgi:hypothetical protein
MDPGNRLCDALARAYADFSCYPLPKSLKASPHRDAAAILRTLSAAPLRELTGEQIGPYSGWALTTVGSVTDYKHFLPRILEQAVRRDAWMGTAPPIIAQRLLMGEWTKWPADEQAAVMDVLREAWLQASSENPDFGADASDWLCALSALEEDIAPLLSGWLFSSSPNASLQIASFARQAITLSSDQQDELIYWNYVDGRRRNQVVAWILSAPVRATLRASLDDFENDNRWRLEQALEALEASAECGQG